MSHPFDLDISDLEAIKLDFEEEVTDQEAATVGGGRKVVNGGGSVTTLALGEEGGSIQPIIPIIQPELPIYTTLAMGEEGGGFLQL